MAEILLVDDDAILRSILSRMLVASGHVVTTASNGDEAIRILSAGSFDLMITDIVMPDREGLDVVREVRARKSPLKVIAMSGGGYGSASHYLEMATMFGASATLEKPFDPQALIETVKRVLVG